MDNRFVKSSISITIFFGVIITLYFLRIDLKQGLSIAAGVAFSVLNLYFLWKMIQEIITTETRSSGNIAGLVVLKFLILWGGFIALMANEIVDPLYFGIGFTILLFVFAMKGFGRWLVDYFGLNRTTAHQKDKSID